MVGVVIRRLLWAAVLLLILSLFTYIIFFVVATPVSRERTAGTGATSLAAQFQVEDKPAPVAWAEFVWGVVRHGEFGHSYADDRPVSEILGKALPVTAALAIGGAMLFMLLAIPIGIISALRPRSLLDRASMIFVLIGVSAHPVFIGLMFSYIFGVKLQIAPITGYCEFFSPPPTCGGAVQWASHMILPWLTFAFLFAALYARMVRASVLEAYEEDYVRTAFAKGASRERVLRAHVLPNALIPIVTMVAMDIGIAFGGVVFIESVYGLPGIGSALFRALPRRDLPVIMGIVLIVCLVVVLANLIAELVYPFLDPRMQPGTGYAGPPRRRRLAGPIAVRAEATYSTPARNGSAAMPRPGAPGSLPSRTGSQ